MKKPKRHPVKKYVERPYRLWDPHKKDPKTGLKGANLPRRYYAEEMSAENAAMRLARWDLKVGKSIEVYNVHHGDLLMVYTRRIKGVEFVRVKKER